MVMLFELCQQYVRCCIGSLFIKSNLYQCGCACAVGLSLSVV
jgi:hypothetical protein